MILAGVDATGQLDRNYLARRRWTGRAARAGVVAATGFAGAAVTVLMGGRGEAPQDDLDQKNRRITETNLMYLSSLCIAANFNIR